MEYLKSMIKAELTNLPQSVRGATTDIANRMRGLELNEVEAATLKATVDQRTRVKPEKGVKVTLPNNLGNNDIATTLTKAQAEDLRNQLLVALQELDGPHGQQTVLLTLDNVRALSIQHPSYRAGYPFAMQDAMLEAERATFAFATKSCIDNTVKRQLHVFERPIIEIKAGRGRF